MQAATAGATIANADGGPPWIVVDHSLDSVIVARWPGRLWRVEILRAATEQPVASANYTRAVSVRVIEEHPVATLFGPHGQSVVDVIEKAMTVSIEDVASLREATHPDARRAYSRAWSRWLGQPDSGSDPNEDHADTLAVSGGQKERSPIGPGFTVLHSVLAGRARSLAGDAAFVVDEEGDQSFAPAWAAATEAFLHAAMAYGAPEVASPADADALTTAWVRLYGRKA